MSEQLTTRLMDSGTNNQPPILLSTASFALQGAAERPELAMEPIRTSGAIFDGIDLYIICDKDGRPRVLPSSFVEWLLSFKITTIHTSFTHLQEGHRLNPSMLSRVMSSLSELCLRVKARALVLHADCLEKNASESLKIIQQALPVPLWLEMMGRDKRYGNRVDHLCDLIREHPGVGIVPDLAHLAEMGNNEQTVFEHALLKNSIQMVHCSLAGGNVPHALQKRWYGREDIDHVPAVLQPEAVNPESANSAARFPMVLEGAIPPGRQGLDILAAETRWWKALHSR